MRIDSDELSYFFELLGKATYYVQHLENSLHHLLAIMEFEGPGSVEPAEAEKVLDKYRRKTLGGLLSEIEKHKFLQTLPIAALRVLNDERKWMIHQILKDENYQLSSNAAYRARIFARLENLESEAQQLNRVVGALVTAVTLSKGVSEKAIMDAMAREVSKIQ